MLFFPKENETKNKEHRLLILRIPINVQMNFIEHESPEDTELEFYLVWFLVLSGERHLLLSS